MQVILIEPVRKLGNVGDIVNVKGGFARNYLIPTQKALRATNENKALFESKKEIIEKENAKKQSEAEKTAKAIDNSFILLTRQAGEDGRLYGSVTSLDISRELSSDKITIDRKQVPLSVPIKYIGIYEINVHLHGEITARVNVNVARSQSEAKEAEKRFKAGEKVMEGPSEDNKAEEEKTTAESSKAEQKESEKERDAKEDIKEANAEENKKQAIEEEETELKTEEKSKKSAKEKE